MRLRVVVLLALLTPSAAAWAAEVVSPVDDHLSVASSLLLSGAFTITTPSAPFGIVSAVNLTFGDGLTVEYCPDAAGGRRSDPCTDTPGEAQQTGGNVTTDARVRIASGGFVAVPSPDAEVRLISPAAAMALGGANVSANAVDVGLGAYAGGDLVFEITTQTLTLRPIGREASIDVREAGDQPRRHNGTAYTLTLSGLESVRLPARSAFLALPEDARVELAQAELSVAESKLQLDDLHAVMRAVLPSDQLDRRADLATAFGPFQVVPAFLNGAVAQRVNMTLNGERSDEFLLLRVTGFTLGRDATNWTGSGEATYVVRGDRIAARPAEAADLPYIVFAVFAALALAGRALTRRAVQARKKRMLQRAARFVACIAILFAATLAIDPVLGVNPILDFTQLSARGRAQLLLLAGAVALAAYLAVGLAASSLTRSALVLWRKKQPALVPVAVGLGAALLLILLEAPALVSAAARVVRL